MSFSFLVVEISIKFFRNKILHLSRIRNIINANECLQHGGRLALSVQRVSCPSIVVCNTSKHLICTRKAFWWWNLFLALNLNSVSFPGRNSGLPRHSTSVASSPSWKLQASIYLANICPSALYLLLLAGDVSSNPGPMKDPCTICFKGCRSNQRAIQCDGCDKWHYAKCLNMGADEYFFLATNDRIFYLDVL